MKVVIAPMVQFWVRLAHPPPRIVVTVFHSTSSATTELSSLLSGDTTTKSSSRLGSNTAASEAVAPKAVVAGAGFSQDEVETMRREISGGEKLAWFHPTKTQAQKPWEPGFMEGVVGRAKTALEEHATGDGGIEAGLFGF